jgi:hypothetical protein
MSLALFATSHVLFRQHNDSTTYNDKSAICSAAKTINREALKCCEFMRVLYMLICYGNFVTYSLMFLAFSLPVDDVSARPGVAGQKR